MELARTAWHVRSRVRNVLVEYLLSRQDLDLLAEEERIRAEVVFVFEKRLDVGDVSRPDVDTARINLANTRLAIRTAEGRVTADGLILRPRSGCPSRRLTGWASPGPISRRLPPRRRSRPRRSSAPACSIGSTFARG